MIKYNPIVSCDIDNITAINTIVKPCSVKIKTATKVKVKDTCINKPPLPTDLFEFINTPISCITTTDIFDVEGSNSYSLRDIAKCSSLPHENIPPSGLLGDENSINTHVSKDAEASCHLVAPFILNKHIHPLGVINHKNHCYMNFVVQLLFSIHRKISQNFQFNSSTEGSISKYLFEIASLSEILFSFILEKYIVCDACGLKSPSFESSSVLYITPTCTSSMQELIFSKEWNKH